MQTEPLTPDAIYRKYWPALMSGLAKLDCRRCGQTAEDFAQRTLANVIIRHSTPADPNKLTELVYGVLHGLLTRHLRECKGQR